MRPEKISVFVGGWLSQEGGTAILVLWGRIGLIFLYVKETERRF